MIIHDVEQGSGEWLKLRLGIPTASMFHKIVTPARGEISAQRRGYMFFLVAERLLNYSLDSLANLEWIARGKELEPKAALLYEFSQDVRTIPIGFVTTDDRRMGCTPDRLVMGTPGALEIKCPAPQTHVQWWVDGFGADYRAQVQGQMLIGEWEWVDRFSYHPEMPPVQFRTYRDEDYIYKLKAAVNQFCDEMDGVRSQLEGHGYWQERNRIITAADDQAKSLGRDLMDYLGA